MSSSRFAIRLPKRYAGQECPFYLELSGLGVDVFLIPRQVRRGRASDRQNRFAVNKRVASKGFNMLKTRLLETYLPSPRAKLQLRTERHGKPYCHGIAARNLHFSVSHAYGLSVMAVSRTRIGIDAEHIDPFTLMVPAVSESRSVSVSPDSAQAGCDRLQDWVRNEARVKAIGIGLVAAQDDARLDQSLHVMDLRFLDAYCLSLATTGPTKRTLKPIAVPWCARHRV